MYQTHILNKPKHGFLTKLYTNSHTINDYMQQLIRFINNYSGQSLYDRIPLPLDSKSRNNALVLNFLDSLQFIKSKFRTESVVLNKYYL